MRIDQGAPTRCSPATSSSAPRRRPPARYRPRHAGGAEHGRDADRRRGALPRRGPRRSTRALRAIERVLGAGNLETLDANALAETLLGDTVFANMMMLGFAWQQGLVPVSLAALPRAIELNGVAVERNRQAFASAGCQRRSGGVPDDRGRRAGRSPRRSTGDRAAGRFLTAYQDAAYAERYAMHGRAGPRGREPRSAPRRSRDAVARSLFKLMAYKDEYEVARLHTETGFSTSCSGSSKATSRSSITWRRRSCARQAMRAGARRSAPSAPGSCRRSACWRG